MQKLIWKNANGEELNLTSGNYGITEWEGFSNTSLNIQSQQVPFQDGGVFLDALMEQRELSVTLAMNDGGNLETRYRLRRELIHILNPKLGEGYLIYTNDFISKRIKCVAQIPLFETHNSNDSGTPKASLAWTACEPYWEDLEESVVTIKGGSRITIANNGDVPCGIISDLFISKTVKPKLINFSENKKIELLDTFTNFININTNVGKKNIFLEEMKFNISSLGMTFYGVAYSEEQMLIVGDFGTIISSVDGENFSLRNSGTDKRIFGICYSNSLDLFVAVGNSGLIITSPDGITWTTINSGVSIALRNIIYSEELKLFIAVGNSGTIITSPDGVTWSLRTSGVSVELHDVIYSVENNIIVAIGNSGTIITSPDGVTWTSRTSNTSNNIYSITYSQNYNMFVAVGAGRLIDRSTDGIEWHPISSSSGGIEYLDISYSNDLGIYIVISNDRKIKISNDGLDWLEVETEIYNLTSVVSVNTLGLIIVVGYSGFITRSNNGKDWNYEFKLTQKYSIPSVSYSEELKLFIAVGYISYNNSVFLLSLDGINWSIKSTQSEYLNTIKYIKETGLFIAVGSAGTILSSQDGDSWTHSESVTNYELSGVTYADIEDLSYYIAVGGHSTILKSEDGVVWTLITNTFTANLYDVTYSKRLGKFVAVGKSGTLLTSTNGVNWTKITLPNSRTNALRSVIFIEQLNMFVIVGENIILTSFDGTEWTINEDFTSNLRCVRFSQLFNLIMAVGTKGEIIKSVDGVNWEEINTNSTLPLNSIVFAENQNKSIVSGDYGVILNSQNTQTESSIINKMSNDSDLSLSLKVGNNSLLLTSLSGSLNGSIRYRQKYIGV